jgi:exosortase E/protease (VPEID-CTERM system)
MEPMVQASKEEVQEACEHSVDAGTGRLATAQPDAKLCDRDPAAADAISAHLLPLSRILPLRLWALAGILMVECLAFAQMPRPWYKQALMPAPIAFGIALLLFGRPRFLQFASFQTSAISKKYFTVHAVAIGVMALANVALLRSWLTSPETIRATIWIWTASLLIVVLSLVAALFPPRQWLLLARSLRGAWVYAALATCVAMTARALAWRSWDLPQSRLNNFGTYFQHGTFLGVTALLRILYTNVVTFPLTNVVGTSRFAVRIEGGCSGIEGVMLMLTLTVAWLIFMRSELRLMRAIWLVPICVAAVWLLNLVRIAALIAIGDAGHPGLAIHGFHTEAGWIFFNAIAIGFLLAAHHVTWLHKDIGANRDLTGTNQSGHSAEVIYLLPFLSIIAASVVSQLLSNGFEWLYPLRFVTALLVLWHFRAEYRKFDWRFGWTGPLAGVLVFILWLWLSKLTGAGGDHTMTEHLASLPLWQRASWLAVRCAAMVVTVPIAEEFAFRGYLARRVMAADIDTVRFDQLGPIAIVVSAVLFGLLHGHMWIAGILAGVVFALAAKLRGRLGDAIAAHVTVNLLLVVWGLASGDYSTW